MHVCLHSFQNKQAVFSYVCFHRRFLKPDRPFLQRLLVLVPAGLFVFLCTISTVRGDLMWHHFLLVTPNAESHCSWCRDTCGGRPLSVLSISCVSCCCRDVQAGARVGHHGDGLENWASHGTVSQTPIWEFGLCFGNRSLWCIRRQPARALQAGPTSPVSHDLVAIVYDECLKGFFLHRSSKEALNVKFVYVCACLLSRCYVIGEEN